MLVHTCIHIFIHLINILNDACTDEENGGGGGGGGGGGRCSIIHAMSTSPWSLFKFLFSSPLLQLDACRQELVLKTQEGEDLRARIQQLEKLKDRVGGVDEVTMTSQEVAKVGSGRVDRTPSHDRKGEVTRDGCAACVGLKKKVGELESMLERYQDECMAYQEQSMEQKRQACYGGSLMRHAEMLFLKRQACYVGSLMRHADMLFLKRQVCYGGTLMRQACYGGCLMRHAEMLFLMRQACCGGSLLSSQNKGMNPI